eukprot:CAMPEP_0198134362 /NCGR_PEP_ID=MMETSP1442-20131203/60039_1 /TAXON_ID= /ORGANISM="Craspedostauros australis, Strain CCMP3328" /LENGTH=234 /DNA_ID=CAMNT_0043795505 /DNA_START=610 /DNA_END=1315 /DNA_ORIENTATION=-
MMIIDTITRLRRYARHMIAIANAQDAALAEKLRKKAELQQHNQPTTTTNDEITHDLVDTSQEIFQSSHKQENLPPILYVEYDPCTNHIPQHARMRSVAITTLLALCCIFAVQGFAPQAKQQQQSRCRNSQLGASRRAFVEAAFGAAAFVAVAPAFAEDSSLDDLSMPSEAADKAAQDAALAEKLRKKAELQKKAARPATFSASLEGEMQKKKEMSAMSKEEKRNRLCEELGRGC